jgi:hypothetical protein
MTNFKAAISPKRYDVYGHCLIEKGRLPPLAACFVAALMCASGALARDGAELGAVSKSEIVSAFVGALGADAIAGAAGLRSIKDFQRLKVDEVGSMRGARALGTQYAQQAVPLVAPTPAAADASQWSPPPGNTGMEPLPASSDPPIARNGAGGLTRPGAARPSEFTLSASAVVTQIMTYHYGATKQPGTISLQHDDGTIYGPWQAAGAVGQGGVKNAYWWAQPNVVLKAGHYLVIDSDPATWSVEFATQGAGIFTLWGHSN